MTASAEKRKRVLFIDHTASLGGGEIALLNLVTNLGDSRYEPVVLLFSDGPLHKRLTDAGIETHVIPLAGNVINARKDTLGFATLMRLPAVWRSLAFTWRIGRFIVNNNISLVHTNSLKADLLGGLGAKLARKPLIWHIRDRIDRDYLPSAVVFVFRWLCKCVPDFVVANSAATLKTVHLDRADRGAAIASGIDLRTRVVHDGMNQLSPDEASTSDKKRTRLVGLVGRISPWKGQHIFLEAAASVVRRFPDVRFQIIGAALFDEEKYELEIHELVDRLGLKDTVEFTGFREDVPALVSRLEILVHASTTAEPFGQVVTEGMIAGKPVVATAGGGVLEIVIDGVTGLLVPMGDAPAMALAICQLLEDPKTAARMGEAGRQRVLEQFAIEHTVAKIERVYDEVLSAREIAAPALRSGSLIRHRLIAGGFSIGLVAVAFAIAELLRWRLGEHSPVTGLFVSAVAIASWRFGEKAGLLATLASLFAAAYVMPPGNSIHVDTAHIPALILFTLVALTITPLIGSLRKAEARARAAQRAAESARAESDFIARAAAAFSVCSSQHNIVRSIARLAIPTLCDWCVVDLVNADMTLSRSFAAHSDPAKYELARQLCLLGVPHGEEEPVRKAVRSKITRRLDAPAKEKATDHDSGERIHLCAQLGSGPSIVVPLNAAGRTFGAISLMRSSGDQLYRATDLKLANEFAWRAAVALAGFERLPSANSDGPIDGEFPSDISHTAADGAVATVF